MKHSFIDKYSDFHSIIHNLDPRTKILSMILMVLSIVLMDPTQYSVFLLYFVVIFIITILSKIKITYIMQRAAIVLPFVFLVTIFMPFMKHGTVIGSVNLYFFDLNITKEGLLIVWNVAIKSYLSSMVLVLLSSTTPFSKLLKGFERLGLPLIFVMILSFMYRYIFVLVDETLKMNNAMHARNARLDHIRRLRVLGNIVGSLFLRTYERAERIYMVMVSRGFDGHVKLIDDLRFSKSDFIFGVLLIAVIAAINIWRING